jgi:hypothetical protein
VYTVRHRAGILTTFLAGSQVNVSWFMAYPHQGGYRVELMNDRDEVVRVLAPNDNTSVAGLYDQT